MYVIGVNGYAQSGKDTTGDILEAAGFKRRAFADKLRESLLALNPFIRVKTRVATMADDGGYREMYEYWPLRDAWRQWGYEWLKENSDLRQLLQRMGTEVGRNLLGANIWVEATMRGLDPTERHVITDCRFPNEAQAVVDAGGIVVRIDRVGVGPATDDNGDVHLSEIAIDDWPFDLRLANNSSLEDFEQKVLNTLTQEPPCAA